MNIPVDLRAKRWSAPGGRSHGHFRPNGKVFHSDDSLVPNNWSSEGPMWSARMFVGFNVGEKPTYDMDDLIKLVRRVRKSQGLPPDSSYVFQKGVYSHSHGGPVVEEDAAQVVFLNLDPDTTPKQFEKQITDLASVIVDKMKQETVIVEIQKNGIAEKTIGVTA